MTEQSGKARPVSQIFRAAIFAGLLLSVLPGAAVAKKKKEKNAERLKALKTVLVQGSNLTAMYVRRNLEESTCLKEAATEEEADAYLRVWEETVPCPMDRDRFCLGIGAQLIDRKTDKTLWFRTDDNMGGRLSAGGTQTAGKWVLWQLSGACCKGR